MEIVGPWPCENCKALAQFADRSRFINRIFCKHCGYQRVIDKRRCRIIENDGTVWAFDADGNKWRVRAS
jgi:hypothetical protein